MCEKESAQARQRGAPGVTAAQAARDAERVVCSRIPLPCSVPIPQAAPRTVAPGLTLPNQHAAVRLLHRPDNRSHLPCAMYVLPSHSSCPNPLPMHPLLPTVSFSDLSSSRSGARPAIRSGNAPAAAGPTPSCSPAAAPPPPPPELPPAAAPPPDLDKMVMGGCSGAASRTSRVGVTSTQARGAPAVPPRCSGCSQKRRLSCCSGAGRAWELAWMPVDVCKPGKGGRG